MAICEKCRKTIGDRATKCKYCCTDRIPNIIDEVIISSTGSFERYDIIEYFDLIYGEVVCPNGLFGAITNGTFFTFSAMADARSKALEELRKKARAVGANAVINADIDISDLNGKGILVSANGTPVYMVPKFYAEKVETQMRQKQQILQKQVEEHHKKEEEIQQKIDSALNYMMKDSGQEQEEYSILEKNIVKIILKQERPTVNNILKGFKNVDPPTCKAAFNKLIDNGIIEVDEFGTCQVKIEI